MPPVQAVRARMRAHAPERCSGSFSRGEERRLQGPASTGMAEGSVGQRIGKMRRLGGGGTCGKE